MEDAGIIELFFERSEQGIRELDIKYGKACRKLSYNIVNNRQDAEECVNDAYLGAWNAIPPVKPDPLLTYICKIVRNISLNLYHRKEAAKRSSHYTIAMEEIEACIAATNAVEAEIEAVELAHIIERFLDTLTVETVVLLSKGEIDSKKVRVEFSLEDMDMSGFQKGATYEQIKAYVLEHTGLKVSSLYISQIKRKCGLDVGQNYNLSKKEDAKVPKCPPEKEAAIRDALKYFQMI